MAEIALVQASYLSKLDKKQLKFLDKQLKREDQRYRTSEWLGFAKSVLFNPIGLLVGGFVLVDWLEGRDESPDLGIVAANTLRGAMVAGVVMDALGKAGLNDAIGGIAKAGGSVVSTALPLLLGAAIPGVPPPP